MSKKPLPAELPEWKTRVVRTVGEAVAALKTLPPNLPIGLPSDGEGEGTAIVLFNRKRPDKCIEFHDNDGTFTD